MQEGILLSKNVHVYPLFPCNVTFLLNPLEMDYSLG